MAITPAPSTPNPPVTVGDGIRQLRTDTHNLTVRTDALGEEYGQLQTQGNNAYNTANDAYENSQAVVDPSTPNPGAASLIGLDANTLATDNTQITTLVTQSMTDLSWSQGEAQRILTALTALATNLPAPASAAFQQAMANFSAGVNQQNQVSFDPTFGLQQAASAVQSLAGDAATVSADVGASVDASAAADQAGLDAETARNQFGEVANLAYPAGYSELQASGYFHQAGALLDQAVSQLPPGA